MGSRLFSLSPRRGRQYLARNVSPRPNQRQCPESRRRTAEVLHRKTYSAHGPSGISSTKQYLVGTVFVLRRSGCDLSLHPRTHIRHGDTHVGVYPLPTIRRLQRKHRRAHHRRDCAQLSQPAHEERQGSQSHTSDQRVAIGRSPLSRTEDFLQLCCQFPR